MDSSKRFTMIAPVDAGIPVAFWIGENLGADRILWVGKYGGEWSFRPFIGIDKDDQVILVDDTMLTGGTMGSLVKYVKSKGSSIVAIAAIVDRREVKEDFDGIPVYSLLNVETSRYKPQKCPLCSAGKKLVEIPPWRP